MRKFITNLQSSPLALMLVGTLLLLSLGLLEWRIQVSAYWETHPLEWQQNLQLQVSLKRKEQARLFALTPQGQQAEREEQAKRAAFMAQVARERQHYEQAQQAERAKQAALAEKYRLEEEARKAAQTKAELASKAKQAWEKDPYDSNGNLRPEP